MLTSRPTNLLEIDLLVEDFIKKHELGIATCHRAHLFNNDEISLRAFTLELTEELRTSCVSFINKENPIDELDRYLFYVVNAFAKQKAQDLIRPVAKKAAEYLCPGCLFLGKDNLIFYLNRIFKCDECEDELKNTVDPKFIAFHRTFFKHNKLGYRCEDCERFIPHPIDESPIVSCPYLDCCFVGAWHSLKRMHHPTSQSNPEKLLIDNAILDGGATLKDKLISNDVSAQTQLEIEETLQNKVKLLREVIDTQKNNVPYSSSDFTIKHKCLAYQAFDNLLRKNSEGMVSYLLDASRSGGFQHKVFQEYIRLLEESFPFSYKKHNKEIKIDSLLDPNLSLFDGISVFDGMVTDKLEVKNGTTEFYIGGRKASYTKPYYMGKILSIVDKKTKSSVIDKLVEYSFCKIKLRDIVPGTEIEVTHLRVPPHYQMGGMVYVNRVRKKIIDRASILLKKGDDV
jgi:hypothetical protein